MALHVLTAFKVGNGAGDFEDAAVGTGREVQTFHGRAEQIEACLVWLSILVNQTFAHLGIAIDALMVLEPFFLYLSGTDDSFTDGGRGLARSHARQLFERNNRHLDMDVHPCGGFIRRGFLTHNAF